MRIGELARAVGVSADTIRFYEKQGLLDSSLYTRSENNYRDYNPAAIERLSMVASAKQLGFTLAEILELSTLWASGHLSEEDKVQILQQKLEELEVKKQALAELQASIEEKVERLQTANGTPSKAVR